MRAKSSYPGVEEMKSLYNYNKVFKSSQITYGVPFQVRIPLTFQDIGKQEESQGIFVTPDEPETMEKPGK